MKAIIIGNYVHRVLGGGQVESCPVDLDFKDPKSTNWKVRNPQEMNLIGGQVAVIGTMLLNLGNLIPENQVLPTIQTVKEHRRDDQNKVVA